jgi:hypothetical protein
MFVIYKYMDGMNIKLFCVCVFIIYENMKQTKAGIHVCSRGRILLLTFLKLKALTLELLEQYLK